MRGVLPRDQQSLCRAAIPKHGVQVTSAAPLLPLTLTPAPSPPGARRSRAVLPHAAPQPCGRSPACPVPVLTNGCGPGPARPGPPLPSAETEVGQRGPAAARRRGPVVVRAPRALLCSPAGTGRPVYLPGSLSRAGSGGVQPCEGPRGMGFKGLGESLCPVGLWRCWYEVACS